MQRRACLHRFLLDLLGAFQKTSRVASSPGLCVRPRAWSVALSSSRGVCEDSSLTVSLGGAREIDKIAPPDRRELECRPFGSTKARRASSDWTTPRAGLGERAERRAGSCFCHESGGMGWCAGWDGDQAAPPSLGPFLCNRRGELFCVRRPRKSPRTDARAEFHVAGVVRDRSLSRSNQVSRGKSPLARIRRSSPQPAAARRSARHDRRGSA